MENIELSNTEIAFVIDGKVIETTLVDNRFAAILLSNPLVLDVTGLNVNLNFEYNYQTGKLFALTPQEVTPHMQESFAVNMEESFNEINPCLPPTGSVIENNLMAVSNEPKSCTCSNHS
jgi:hypothetical protein